MSMTSKKITIGLCVTICLSGSAYAQDQTIEDRFKPRVYGNLSLAQSNTVLHTQPRSVLVEPVPHRGATHIVQSSAPTGSYTPAELQEEAKRVIAFQNAAQSLPYSAPERRYEIELFDTPQAVPTSTALSNTSQNYATQTFTHGQAHIVTDGDTLYNVAKRYNTTVDVLRSTNNLTGNNIRIGQNITIPTTSRHVVSTAPVNVQTQAPSSNLIRTVQPIPSRGIYAVLPKDTLYSISKRACVTVEGIQTQNNLGERTDITPGQRLNMPQGHCLN